MSTLNHRLSDIMALIQRLRGENGCPWDRKQTARSMAPHLTEETYELVDAILAGPPEAVREEMGDVLFQLMFIAHLYQEDGHFDIDDALADIMEKMTRRHPHVFGDAEAATPEAVKDQWHRIKGQERKGETVGGRLSSVPVGLPALMRAHLISDRAARAGFGEERDGFNQRLETVEEKLAALKPALSVEGDGAASRAFGETLLEMVHLARRAGIHPESALSEAVRRFQGRFEAVENAADKMGASLEDLPPEEKRRLWEAAGNADQPERLDL
jgi:tetrapyrrole methylase family protein/MazG family protein